MFRSRKGFTLIELLIVITIIGILSVAFIPQLTGGQARARDSRRLADLQQIGTALSLYADDNGGIYPSSEACVSEMTTELGPYLTTIPDDPQAGNGWADGECMGTGNPGKGYSYIPTGVSGSSASGFILIAELENTNTTSENTFESATFAVTDTGVSTKDILDPATTATTVPCDGNDCPTEGAIYIYAR